MNKKDIYRQRWQWTEIQRQTDRQEGRQAGRQTDRQTPKEKLTYAKTDLCRNRPGQKKKTQPTTRTKNKQKTEPGKKSTPPD